MLDAYAAAGGNFIDTADSYSAWVPGTRGGESETIIGRWMAARGNRDDDRRSRPRSASSPASRARAGDDPQRRPRRSLERLGRPTASTSTTRTTTTPTRRSRSRSARSTSWSREGNVRYVGASNFTAARLAEALAVAEREGLPASRRAAAAVQPGRTATIRGRRCATLCVARGRSACVPYYGSRPASSPASTGPAARRSTARARRGGAAPISTTRGLAVLAALDEIAAAHDTTVAAVALGWLARPADRRRADRQRAHASSSSPSCCRSRPRAERRRAAAAERGLLGSLERHTAGRARSSTSSCGAAPGTNVTSAAWMRSSAGPVSPPSPPRRGRTPTRRRAASGSALRCHPCARSRDEADAEIDRAAPQAVLRPSASRVASHTSASGLDLVPIGDEHAHGGEQRPPLVPLAPGRSPRAGSAGPPRGPPGDRARRTPVRPAAAGCRPREEGFAQRRSHPRGSPRAVCRPRPPACRSSSRRAPAHCPIHPGCAAIAQRRALGAVATTVSPSRSTDQKSGHPRPHAFGRPGLPSGKRSGWRPAAPAARYLTASRTVTPDAHGRARHSHSYTRSGACSRCRGAPIRSPCG